MDYVLVDFMNEFYGNGKTWTGYAPYHLVTSGKEFNVKNFILD